jgi:MFS family permease
VIPRLPRAAWVVLAGDALSAIGSGITLPFLLVYLHTVRGMSLTLAGLAVATVAVASLVGNPVGGALTDRFSARRALLGGLVVSAVGAILLLFVRAPWQAFAATATIGLGASIAWPAQDALLAAVAGSAARSDVFSVRHATLNAGLAIGALIASTIVDTTHPQTFTILYLADAVTFLAVVPILLTLRVPRSDPRSRDDIATRNSFRLVLRDRVFVRVWALCAFVVAISYGQLHAAFPAYATRPGGIPTSALSLAYCANALTVVAAQLVVLRLLRGRRRTTAIALACAALAAAWQITIAAGQLGSGTRAEITFAAALVVFALAETLLAPSFVPLVNDIAPERLRGRYNGMSALAWTTGVLLGPAIAGVALDAGIDTFLFAGLMAASGGAALWARHLARHLQPDTNVIQPS